MVTKNEISTFTKIKNRCWSPVSLLGGSLMGIIMFFISYVIGILWFHNSFNLQYLEFLLMNLPIRIIVSYFVMILFIRPTSLKLANSLFDLEECGTENLTKWEKLKKKLWSPASLLMSLMSCLVKTIVSFFISILWYHHIFNLAFIQYLAFTWIIKALTGYIIVILLVSPVSLKLADSFFNIDVK